MQRRPGRVFLRERLRYDATYALEVGYCFDHGIPYSEYLERWGPQDRARVASVALERSEHCPSCGTSQHEWDADQNAYEAVVWRCRGCMLRELMQGDTARTEMPKGSSIRLLPRAAAERLARQREEAQAAGSLRPRRRGGDDR